uniref:Uncharacterized protein n=1 Tax=Romanomermis culicivorax TaxID=13658 RepID=A0A915ISX5_ROMCU
MDAMLSTRTALIIACVISHGEISALSEILFELRQKPFELPSTTENYNLYKLCRIWLNGKDICVEDCRSKDGNNASHIRSFQHMAINIKQIENMPRIRIDNKVRRVPSPIAEDLKTIEGAVDVSSKEAMLASFMPRWKRTKRKWNKTSREFSQNVAAENLKILKESFVPSASYFYNS